MQLITEFVDVAKSQTPDCLMGYLNPLSSLVIRLLSDAAKETGLNGILLVDLTLQTEAIDCSRMLPRQPRSDLIICVPNDRDIERQRKFCNLHRLLFNYVGNG